MEQTEAKQNNFMVKLATFIVDKRNLFFLITVIALIFSGFSRNWVQVENELTAFLPDDAETKLALDVMEEQFTTYGTARVMAANVTYSEAAELADALAEIDGVQSVTFDDSADHYSAASALFDVTFDYDENDDACLDALDAVKDALAGYDLFISTELGSTLQDTIAREVSVIMVYVAVIVVVVLTLTSQTYGEVPVLLLTFVTAMILNQGSNFLLGKISFVSNSVTSILQLALSLDYAVILCNRFKEEHQTLPIREAAIVLPAGDYEKEAALLAELEGMDGMDYTMGLANVEAMDGYMLADRLTPRQFGELAGLDYETATVVYAAYAADQGDYAKLAGNIADYKVPLIDMFLFVCQQVDSGVVTLDGDVRDTLADAERQMKSAKAQLSGPEFDRVLVYLTLPVSGDETYAFTDTLRETAQKYYPDGTVYVAGNSTNEYDFEKSFSRDNMVVSIVSILIVLVVLLFTFKSAGMPILLILVIQGSIWINFSVPALTDSPLFFMSYLVVSSIQMGANIDYAIVIASRYQELKNTMPHRDAMIETLNFAFPTVLTSGCILSVSGILIGQMTSEPTICGIGQCLGRGTIISMFLVLFVLPQILLIGGGITDKTSFSVPKVVRRSESAGHVYVNGIVTGQIRGTVSGYLRGSVDGEADLNVLSGSVSGASEGKEDERDEASEQADEAPEE